MLNYDKLPEPLRGAMQRYIEHGIIPGDFLQAVICNDLKESFGRADEGNIARMFDIVSFMYNEVPLHIWGSKERMITWHKMKTRKRFTGLKKRHLKPSDFNKFRTSVQ